MGLSSSLLASFLLLLVLGAFVGERQAQNVPALFLFGDSVFDVGNNNNLFTLIKSNFPPYGRDFKNKQPTGRFCNGKLASDYTAEFLGFTTYQVAYLSREASGKNLLIGANFASAASGYFDTTADLYHAIPLTRQLEYYKEYQDRVVGIAGSSNASKIIRDSIYLLSAGSSDFLQNYYIDPLLQVADSFERFSNILLQSYTNFIQSLYALGARRIGVITLPPIGCLPAAITIFGLGGNKCVARLNKDAVSFNAKLNVTSQRLQHHLSGLKLVVLDIYETLLNYSTDPAKHGFSEARRSCCGTGLFETAVLCNPLSVGTCANATEYVFWDGFHPSEAANSLLAQLLISSGVPLIN